MKDSFKDLKMNENNPKWEKACMRVNDIYKRPNDVRSDFERDYNRIVNSNAYKRLNTKHKSFSLHIMIIYVQELNMLLMLNQLVIQLQNILA